MNEEGATATNDNDKDTELVEEMNTSSNKVEKPSTEVSNEHFGRKSHTGLSALLNAVTLQLSKSDEEPMAPTEAKFDETDSDEAGGPRDPSVTTPTIVPEAHPPSISKNSPFPAILMTLVMDPNNADKIEFLPDGKYFALRVDDFETTLQKEVPFKCCENNYASFSTELSSWGFSFIETKRPGIEVYRHRLFRKGDFKRCDKMKQNDADSRDVPLAATSRTSSVSEDDPLVDRSDQGAIKRRLSPSSASKNTAGSSSKLRVQNEATTVAEDGEQSDNTPKPPEADFRRMALSIATEKLNILDDRALPLAHQAVAGATHTIVSDAIEALLRDENHTRQTFQKHETELSKSSVPGLVPISKQLFSVGEEQRSGCDANGESTNNNKANKEARPRTRTLSLENARPEDRSAASSLLQVANSSVTTS